MKQFVVIGCGRFGTSVATTLYKLGCDVLAIDKNEEIIKEISDKVTHAVQADALDESTLKTLGIRNFDVAIVTIGSNMQASTMATLITKELGVPMVVVKAQDELHAKVLGSIGADRVVFPEKDMGNKVAHNLVAPNILESIQFAPNYSIVEIEALEGWIGKTLIELQLPARHGINVIAIKRGEEINVSPHATEKIQSKDILMILGHNKDLRKFQIQ